MPLASSAAIGATSFAVLAVDSECLLVTKWAGSQTPHGLGISLKRLLEPGNTEAEVVPVTVWLETPFLLVDQAAWSKRDREWGKEREEKVKKARS